MAIQILQKPGDIQPAQSPIIFSVTETTTAYTASEFQYTGFLYIWDGDINQSGSYKYQLRKFPNATGSGIFDFSRLVNSNLLDLSADNKSNILYYKAEFGFQYASGSTYVTQSGGLTPVTCSAGGTPFKAYDGYALFPDPINSTLHDINPCWPFMTDMCTVTQSITLEDTSLIGPSPAYRGLAMWVGDNDNGFFDQLVVTASYANGNEIRTIMPVVATGSTLTSLQISSSKAAPGDSWDPLPTTSGSSPLVSYTINAVSSSVRLASLNYEIDQECYYTPIRVAYKNKYGQFDWFNFYKRHNNTFNTDQRVYQPQLGSWSSTVLEYNEFQTRTQRYIVDATEVIEVNTDYLTEGYNNLFKQLLVAEEIYWQTDGSTGAVRPLTIQTNSITFKTGVNNKLIQYTLVFDIGQPYKLIL